MMRSFLAACATFCLYCSVANCAAAALTVQGYTPATAGQYDRFENDPSFIGNGFDWSGVGRTGGGR